MSDKIANLPTDNNPMTSDEVKLTNAIFQSNLTVYQKIFIAVKEYFIIFLLFFFISLPVFDPIIQQFVGSAQNNYILLIIKAFIFTVIFFIINNIYCVTKK